MRGRARVLLVLLLAALAGVPGARAGEELLLPPVTRATLDNGLRVLVAEYHELPLVELVALVGAGAAEDPPGKEGLAAVTAAVLRRGTSRLSAEELAEQVEFLGGSLSSSAGHDAATVSAEFLARDFTTGLGLVAAVLRAPALDRDEVRRVRDELRAELVAEREQPAAVANLCFAAFLYGRHPYGRPVQGFPRTLARIGRSEVREFYRRYYRPANTLLVVVGDVVGPAAVVRVREAFGSWRGAPGRVPPPPRPAPISGRRLLLVDKPDATQTQIRFGNISLARNDPDYLTATVANTALGGAFSSRLVEELRIKRSLTYGAWSYLSARRAGGDFRVGTFTKTHTTRQALDLALSVLGDFRSHPPRDEELARARSYLRGQFPIRLETPEALASRLAAIEWYGLPRDELATYRRRVASVSAGDVARVVARAVPDPANLAIVVVGPATVLRAALKDGFGAEVEVKPEACEHPGVGASAPPEHTPSSHPGRAALRPRRAES